LAAAATSGSQLYSVLAMVSYALGYTTIIFLASLFTGLAKQARSLMQYSEIITRIGSAGLILMGGFYLINGIQWIVAISKL
jgi:cytochrome c-type biogenesis protein